MDRIKDENQTSNYSLGMFGAQKPESHRADHAVSEQRLYFQWRINKSLLRSGGAALSISSRRCMKKINKSWKEKGYFCHS